MNNKTMGTYVQLILELADLFSFVTKVHVKLHIGSTFPRLAMEGATSFLFCGETI